MIIPKASTIKIEAIINTILISLAPNLEFIKSLPIILKDQTNYHFEPIPA